MRYRKHRPCRKKRYRNQDLAELAIMYLALTHPNPRDVDRLETYRCKRCRRWHFGHRATNEGESK